MATRKMEIELDEDGSCMVSTEDNLSMTMKLEILSKALHVIASAPQ